MTAEIKKRILAIDYGTKRVGIAISDPFCLFPSITLTIPNDRNIIMELLNMIEEKDVGKIILGYPENNDGKISKVAEEILKFKVELKNKTNLEIELWDENLTSQIASSRIIQTVFKKSKRRDKALVDAQSAAIILEEYLRSLK